MGLAILWNILFLILCGILLRGLQSENPLSSFSGESSKARSRWNTMLGGVVLGFLILRLVFAVCLEGYPSDMSCWRAWGYRMETLGPRLFYDPEYFCDYPPGYLYILGMISKISSTLGYTGGGPVTLYKFPGIFADFILFTIIYRLAKEYWGKEKALLIGSFFLIAPIFWFDSAVWGQIESVLLLFLIPSLLLLSQKKYMFSYSLYVLACLIKPQGLIFAPIYLIALLESRSIKKIFLTILGAFCLFELLTIPFSPAWQESAGISAFLHALNPLWIIEKYFSTMASYPYFTVNAFNLYGLLGLNWVSIEDSNPLFYSICNGLWITIAVCGSFYCFCKIKDSISRLMVSGYFLFGFLYTFAFKMHERYLLLPLILLLIDFIVTKNKKKLYLFTGLSVVGMLNLYYVLQLVLTTQTAPDYSLVAPISLLEVLLFLGSVWVIAVDDLGFGKNRKRFSPFLQKKTDDISQNPLDLSAKNHSMVRKDYLAMTIITLVYAVTAYTNLGDTRAPQTFYQPQEENESFVISLENKTMISEIDSYCGIGDVDKKPGIQFYYSEDGETWQAFHEPSCVLEAVFRWEAQLFEPISARYLKGVCMSTDYRLFEMGLRDLNGNLIPVASIDGNNNPTLSAMMDEQECVTGSPSYENGTYFDEIYHPRTAYEHLHGMPYYETTHPPLGKLFMAVGIAIFGMTPFGWRFSGTLFGVMMLPIFYYFLKRMFGRTRYAVLGTLLFAFDFMHYSLTRMATIDSYPVLFILGMYYFMYCFGESAIQWANRENPSRKKQLLYLGLSGLCMGLGCASKWTAVYASVGLALELAFVILLTYRNLPEEQKSEFVPYWIRTGLWCALFFLLIPAIIYAMSYLPIAMVDGYGNVFEAMWNNQKYMLSYHAELNGTHPYSSPWYTWPFVYRPMWAYQAPAISVAPDQIGCISIFQNPLLSWIGIGAIFYALYRGWKKRDRRVLFLLIGLLAQYLPWIFVQRYTLQYHFFATLPFVILFIVYVMEDLEKRFSKIEWITTTVTVVCLLMFLAFYPVISGVPSSEAYVATFLEWFPSWVFRI